MATLDDKLLGEKLHYYCSSSEDEGSDSETEDKCELEKTASEASTAPVQQAAPWSGTSANTGPKGVVQDYLAFKNYQKEKQHERDLEVIDAAKKLTLACRTEAEDEAEKAQQEKDEELFAELLEDDDNFMKEYMQARIKQIAEARKKHSFGELVDIASTEQFLKEIDCERPDVSVVILLYERGAVGCDSMINAFKVLSSDYPNTKFCCIRASIAGLSWNFKTKGVPAILVYQSGQLTANYVKLLDEFGKEVHPGDVENFLIENCILHDRTLVPSS